MKGKFFATPKGFSFENVAVYFPRITPEFEGISALPEFQQLAKKCERGEGITFSF